ncbi:MAG: DinB family protein, partial [Mobilicoccus sp.]|nr:DinB family protein [Mobilicoccus sp.]
MTLTPTLPALLQTFRETRALTDRLTRDLSAEDQTPQSMTEASPVKWHRAHTTWFFEEFILRADPAYRPRHPEFRFLFNSYYEAVGARHPRPERGLVTRPGVAEVAAYRADVEERVDAALAAGDLDDNRLALVELGCHHEQQHQELILSDLKHLFSGTMVDPVYVERPADEAAEPVAQRWISVPGGLTEIGHAGGGFAYDNEGPRHRVWIEDVEIATRVVTNAEWMEFIADDGYARPELW